MNVYLSGPMTGRPHFNFPAFFDAAKLLRNEGYTVFCPAEHDAAKYGDGIWRDNADGCPYIAAEEYGFNLREALAVDMAYICNEADGIAMLPGWEGSKGARAEHALAVALGHKIIYL